MDPLAWLFSLEQFGIKFGLDNILTLVDALDHPERAFQSVHIAGTNGKGSVTAMVDAALGAAGHKSARYTSPHLVDLVERFVIEGRPVDQKTLAGAVSDVRAAVDRLRQDGRLEASPTFFEVTTAVAFELFRRSGVEIAVCEVGMGGRLDATNVLSPVVTAITTVGFDHQRYLGETLAEIAAEKAGIIKPGVPVVVGRLPAAAQEVIATIARERGAPIVDATAAGIGRDVRLVLPGAHQIDNAAVAVHVLELLDRQGIGVPPEAIAAGLERVVWPGRLETRRLADGREALLDAAHNPDGAAALAAFLAGGRDRSRPLVFATMRDKDARSMLRVLLPAVGALIVTRASNPRSANPSDVAAAARALDPERHIAIASSPSEALAAAWALSPRIVVAGSIFLLGDVMKELDGS
jgi:dihydrofolate synthase / folylpolyglutamate synthase